MSAITGKDLTPEHIYGMRNTELLTLPDVIRKVIDSIYLQPTAPPAFRKTGRRLEGNWRSRILVEFHSKLKDTDDPEYTALRMTLNKLVKSNIEMVIKELLKGMETRAVEPELFRLRIVNLLFNQGITMPSYSALIADVCKAFIQAHPDAKEDLAANCNMDALNTMFNMSETMTFPSSELPGFDDLVCKWNKQRERRRGFIIFVSDLFARNLVSIEVMKSAVDLVLPDLETNMRSPATPLIAENVDQTVTFLFEMMRAIKDTPIGKEIKERLSPLLAAPRAELPCLGMRSRFKMEDILKM